MSNAPKDEQRTSDGLLCKCKKRPKDPPHECPFMADVHNDSKFRCECCRECRRECLNDI